MKVLFVCTGNTCRSPMAEASFNHLCNNNENVSSFSRGINVFLPQPINPKSKSALAAAGIDFNEDFLSQQISLTDINDADLILTMTSDQKQALKVAFPKYKNKIFSLCEKAYGKDGNIDDPFGQSEDVYVKCFNQIEKAVKVIYEQNFKY